MSKPPIGVDYDALFQAVVAKQNVKDVAEAMGLTEEAAEAHLRLQEPDALRAVLVKSMLEWRRLFGEPEPPPKKEKP